MKAKFLVSFLFMFLLGCAAITPPKNFDQTLAYAYGTHTAILVASTNAVKVGALTPEEGQSILKTSDEARVMLDLARGAAFSGDPKTAEGQLQLAISVLSSLQVYINSRAPK